MVNYIVAEFNPLYTPFDYSFLPVKEYIPPISDTPTIFQWEPVSSETPKPIAIARRNTKPRTE